MGVDFVLHWKSTFDDMERELCQIQGDSTKLQRHNRVPLEIRE